MPTRNALLVTVGLLAGAPGAFASGPPEIDVEHLRRQQQREVIRDLLDRDRWRRLEAARFDFDLSAREDTPDLIENPGKQADLEKVFFRSLLEVAEESVERQLGLEERHGALRAKLARQEDVAAWSESRRARPLRFSPQLDLNAHSTFGMKLSFGGRRNRFWRGAAVRVRHEVAGDDLSVKLTFDDDVTRAYVTYHSDRNNRGQSIEWKIGFWF